MKKFVIFMLVAMLMVASLGTAAAAEVPGTSVTIPVTVSGEFANYLININADAGLTIQSISGAGSSVISSATSAKANWASASNVASHTVYVTVFIDPAIAPGNYYVTASASRASKAIDVAVDTEDGIADGLTATTVSVSGGVVVIEAPACEHNWGAWTQTKAPTCKETGLEERVCSLCGEKQTREVAKTAHDWSAWSVTEATCTAEGEKTRTCSICGETETEKLAMVPHTFIDWCKDEGKHWHECSVCGHVCDEAAHTWGSWQTVRPATETEDGLKVRLCTVCGEDNFGSIPAGMDDVPETGDISPRYNLGVVATFVLSMFCVVAFVTKRRFVK